MPYKEGDEKKYFSTIAAALLVITIAIAGLIFSILTNRPVDLGGDGVSDFPSVNPLGNEFPVGPPSVPAPTSPPPH